MAASVADMHDVCPEVFSLDDDELAEAIDEEMADDGWTAQEAEEQCPTGAIVIE